MPPAQIPSVPGTVVMLFTESYPFDIAHEATFIEPELRHLRDAFSRVILVPARTGGQRAALPAGVEVDLGLASELNARSSPRALTLRALRSQLLWRDLLERPIWGGWPKAIR